MKRGLIYKNYILVRHKEPHYKLKERPPKKYTTEGEGFYLSKIIEALRSLKINWNEEFPVAPNILSFSLSIQSKK